MIWIPLHLSRSSLLLRLPYSSFCHFVLGCLQHFANRSRPRFPIDLSLDQTLRCLIYHLYPFHRWDDARQSTKSQTNRRPQSPSLSKREASSLLIIFDQSLLGSGGRFSIARCRTTSYPRKRHLSVPLCFQSYFGHCGHWICIIRRLALQYVEMPFLLAQR